MAGLFHASHRDTLSASIHIYTSLLLAIPYMSEPRYDWYQTETEVVIGLFVKGLRSDQIGLECSVSQVGLSLGRTVPPSILFLRILG